MEERAVLFKIAIRRDATRCDANEAFLNFFWEWTVIAYQDSYIYAKESFGDWSATTALIFRGLVLVIHPAWTRWLVVANALSPTPLQLKRAKTEAVNDSVVACIDRH